MSKDKPDFKRMAQDLGYIAPEHMISRVMTWLEDAYALGRHDGKGEGTASAMKADAVVDLVNDELVGSGYRLLGASDWPR